MKMNASELMRMAKAIFADLCKQHGLRLKADVVALWVGTKDDVGWCATYAIPPRKDGRPPIAVLFQVHLSRDGSVTKSELPVDSPYYESAS